MSIMGRVVPIRVVVAAVVLLVGAAGALALAWGPKESGSVREIRLVARGMAFYLESDPATPNPVIDVRAGERIRVVLANEERGMVHDFAVPAFSVALDQVRWNETGSAVIDVPARPGTYPYTCRPHDPMMRGTLRISAP